MTNLAEAILSSLVLLRYERKDNDRSNPDFGSDRDDIRAARERARARKR